MEAFEALLRMPNGMGVARLLVLHQEHFCYKDTSKDAIFCAPYKKDFTNF